MTKFKIIRFLISFIVFIGLFESLYSTLINLFIQNKPFIFFSNILVILILSLGVYYFLGALHIYYNNRG